MVRIAINGFGRIGRSFLRAYLADKSVQSRIQIVAINIGPAQKEWIAHLFKYDSFMGTWSDAVSYEKDCLIVGVHRIPIIAVLEPEDADWGSLHIDWVVDATGKFTQRDKAQQHIDAGAKKVLITAFAQDPDCTLVLGVNDKQYDHVTHKIVSMASCTANALYPIVKVLHESFDLTSVIMNTMHSYTNRQVLMDIESVNLRRSRGAAVNIIPTSLCAPDRITEVYPAFTGSISGQSTRIPIGKVSLLDVAFCANKVFDRDAVHQALILASRNELKGIIHVTQEELVSHDYMNNPYSVIIDAPLTQVTGKLGKVFSWYDNEAGYSHRLKDFLAQYG